MSKKSFILYHDTYDSIKWLKREQKGELLDAIFHYANDPDVCYQITDDSVQMAFNFIRSQMDRDADKYETFKEKQRLNGMKGGRPKNNPTLTQDNPNNPSLLSETQKSLNDTVTVNVTDNVNGNDIKKEYSVEFEDFWFAYPKNNASKKAAYKSYLTATKGATHEEIIRSARQYANSITDTRYTKHATTWLNQDGWTVDYTVEQNTNPSKFMESVAGLFE